MARWWSNSRWYPTNTPASNRFRPQLEGFEERFVPDANPVAAVQSSTATETAATTGVSIDFTLMPGPNQTTVAADTITITITPQGGQVTTVTVNVPAGSTPAAIAGSVATALQGQGFNATVNGNTVNFTVFANADVTTTHTNNANNDPRTVVAHAE